ncbi:Mu-like prophage major head subunit gpT family protein [Rhodobacter sp. Har01]|nr:Mu-like prophage major head subunit gpT family protein [Rhodobacter sp. Har01]
MREWIGPRVVNNLSAYGFTITNRKFESTVSVSREDIADGRLGTFKPAFAEMGGMARRHPDELIFGLLKNGFNSPPMTLPALPKPCAMAQVAPYVECLGPRLRCGFC